MSTKTVSTQPPKNKQNKNVNKRNRKPRRRRQIQRNAPIMLKTQTYVGMTQQNITNGVRMSGRDLITPGAKESSITSGNAFALIPCNPFYWVGTKVSTTARGYQRYRPLKMIFEYVPQVPTTQRGTVICGTLWGKSDMQDEYIQQSLTSSNGGTIFNVSSRSRCQVDLSGRHLTRTNYSLQGKMAEEDTNPFMFMAITSGADNVAPGFFLVHWEFEFTQPSSDSTDVQVTTSETVTDPSGNGLLSWGISLIKTTLIPLLRNAAVCLLRGAADALTGATSGTGTILTVPDRATQIMMLQGITVNDDVVPLIDSKGNATFLPGDTPVFLYEAGEKRTRSTGSDDPMWHNWPVRTTPDDGNNLLRAIAEHIANTRQLLQAQAQYDGIIHRSSLVSGVTNVEITSATVTGGSTPTGNTTRTFAMTFRYTSATAVAAYVIPSVVVTFNGGETVTWPSQTFEIPVDVTITRQYPYTVYTC